MKRNSGFTLIELLVVITIIGILAGLAFPAIQGALNAAKKAEANAMANQLKIALTSYQTEYGIWPTVLDTSSEVESDDTTLYNILIGDSSTTSSGQNPRRIVFMEFNSKSLNPSGSGFLDPWKNTYRIKVDHDYDNQITDPGSITINASIIVWSNGKDGSFQTNDPKTW
ncbi:MAG: type II secretion system protein [Verrucomicrobiota bacterium]